MTSSLTSMDSQFIFVYGTLMSGQPEHEAYFPVPLSIKPAAITGSLYQLKEGYPILRIDPSQIIGQATNDPISDWSKAKSEATPSNDEIPKSLIHGELLEYPSDTDFLKKTDEWEGFTPWQAGIYRRCLAEVILTSSGDIQLAWVYACSSEPPNATRLNSDRWQRPDWLAFD